MSKAIAAIVETEHGQAEDGDSEEERTVTW